MNTKAVWKCMIKGCNYTAPPTPTGCKQVIGHMLRHANKGISKEERKYALVDEGTGEVLANKIDEAKKKGFLSTEEPKLPAGTETPPEELLGGEAGEEVEPEEEEELKEPSRVKEKAEKEGKEVREISSDGIFRYTITLPADAFTMFNIAKANGLEPKGKLFDEFVWECITARYEKDYKKQLILAPIEE